MTDIVVEIRKGMVSGIYSDLQDARFVVVDWDLVERLDEGDQIASKCDHEGLSSMPVDSAAEYQAMAW